MVEGTRILREYAITTCPIAGHRERSKPVIADYVLVYCEKEFATLVG